MSPAAAALLAVPVRHDDGRRLPRRQRRGALLWLGILGAAAALRLPALFAGLPYLNYVDEGHVLHRTVRVLHGNWDPGWYIYGAFPNYAIAAAAWLYSPIYGAVHGHSLRQGLSSDPPRDYDLVEPPELLVLGRSLSLLFALGIVALAGALAGRLAGASAGLFAGWWAALMPPLAMRGATINVDNFAVFFVLAALFWSLRLLDDSLPACEAAAGAATELPAASPAPRDVTPPATLLGRLFRAPSRARDAALAGADTRNAALAGAATGLALVSKYPAVTVAAAVVVAVAWCGARLGEKLRLLAIAGCCALAAAVCGMPALVLRTGPVVHALRYEASLYAGSPTPTYWSQAVHQAEWDQPLAGPELGYPFLLLSGLALASALADRRTRRPVVTWLAFACALLVLLLRYPFQPLRNLLALIVLACVLVALLYARVRRRATRATGANGANGEMSAIGPFRATRPSRGVAVDLAAALLPLLLFGGALRQITASRLTLVDTRRQAMEWLAARSGPEDRVLFASELDVLDSERSRLRSPSDEAPWPKLRSRVGKLGYRFVVLGRLTLRGGGEIPPAAWDEILRHYEVKARFGRRPVPECCNVFHSNRQAVIVLERR